MVAIKPSSQLKHEEEIIVHGLSTWRKWFYISFAVVAYFLITVTMFHSHKLMSHHEETLLHGSPNSLTGHGHHHPHSHHPHGHGHSHPHHHGNNHYSHPSDQHSSKEWDFLIFTQHWPNTVCMQWNEKTGHGCNFPADKDMWSIHGIWPTKNNSMGPFFCTKDHFNPSLIEPITNDLNVYWLDVEKGRQQNDLWQHEWAKHGTCAQADPLLDSELKYFSQGLQWFKKYNMENILKKYQILPKAEEEGGVNVLDIWHAVRDANGKTPVIRCETDQVTSKKYLFEIRICFDKNLQLQDCDSAKAIHKDEDFMYDDNINTNCPLGQPIFYPSTAPNLTQVSPKKENRALSTLKSFRSYLQNLFMEKDSENAAFQP